MRRLHCIGLVQDVSDVLRSIPVLNVRIISGHLEDGVGGYLLLLQSGRVDWGQELWLHVVSVEDLDVDPCV